MKEEDRRRQEEERKVLVVKRQSSRQARGSIHHPSLPHLFTHRSEMPGEAPGSRSNSQQP